MCETDQTKAVLHIQNRVSQHFGRFCAREIEVDRSLVFFFCIRFSSLTHTAFLPERPGEAFLAFSLLVFDLPQITPAGNKTQNTSNFI